ncbi:hypothetical protein CL622_00500 [archaeon]|nr:hypothetical protein [archaeon]
MDVFALNKREIVLNYFLNHPTEVLHLRAFARAVNVSFPWARKVIMTLSKQNLVIIEKKHGLILVQANREHPGFKTVKRSHNLLALYKSGIIEYLVEQFRQPGVIVLFGSYSRGEDTEQSDIDIAVFTSKHPTLNLVKFEKKLGRTVAISELLPATVKKEFWHTLANGIVLYGYLELA